MYLSRKMSIDFVAHHEIQFQSCRGVFEELSTVHDCRALIGQDSNPTGADVAVLLDHCVFQQKTKKPNYKYLIHMSHDLGDWDVYRSERKALSEFDLLLVPGDIHYQYAKKHLGYLPVFEIGWPKLDMTRVVGHAPISNPLSIIYAPTYVDNREWVSLLPALIETGHQIIIKNHIYYDFESGALPPTGSEKEYSNAISSLREMEAFVARCNAPNVEYIDRRSNLCSLFHRAQLLITDSSSASLEFLSYGLSIETGRYGEPAHETKPFASLVTDRVKYLSLDRLTQLFKNDEGLLSLVERGVREASEICNPFIYSPPHSSSKYAASLIDLFFYSKQNESSISFCSDTSLFQRVKKWL